MTMTEGFDFEKLRLLNHAGGVVNVASPSVNFEELRARSNSQEVKDFADDLEAMCKSIEEFKAKYPQIYS